ncbi:hypothetical protein NM688_g3613 [Phlebia brevispora]|uniref:Uncharacterized protein n=1 Tax=Phlebia brevispora TaxID=194682 RepID=A0ACC1T515_9APHY|nr:hypothetical protein NM688_g3613 [Phlebia brevispora]
MVCLLILIVSLFALGYARIQSRRADMKLHEYITSIPAGFVDGGPADPDSTLDLRIALTQNNIDGLIKTFHNVAMLTAPAPETLAAVNAWLQAAGLNATTSTNTGDLLRLNTTVSVANQLLDAEFSLFTNTHTGAQSIRTLNYSIPVDLVGHVQFVHPTISFPSSAPLQSNSTIIARTNDDSISNPNATILARANHPAVDPTACGSLLVTPDCVLRMHTIPAATIGPPTGSIGVAGMNDLYANQADLKSFLEFYRRDITKHQAKFFRTVSINGGQNLQDITEAGLEANVDTQYTVGIAAGVPVTFYTIGREDLMLEEEALLNYLQTEEPDDLPNVLLISYGSNERLFSSEVSTRLCTGFAALGARGVSVIVSSMDGGVGGTKPDLKDDCPEGKFVPAFPASCPYVTAVGATAITLRSGHLWQVAADYSGGGFSIYFTNKEEFSWQTSAVQAYLRNLEHLHPEYDGLFEPKGRAYPDVAAVATNLAFDWRDKATMGSGTSLSAPIFASMIALINAERLAIRKSPLGFLNKFLYANPQAFVDIIEGELNLAYRGVVCQMLTSVIGGTNPGCKTEGFLTAFGWNPVTGLGSPMFDALKAAALAWE